MDLVDRSAIPALHAAARRHRAVYLSCLFTNFRNWLTNVTRAGSAVRHAPCG